MYIGVIVQCPLRVVLEVIVIAWLGKLFGSWYIVGHSSSPEALR
jgi:hypothetical protein